MSARQIEKLLKRALLHNGPMVYALYEYELEESLDELKASLLADHDDYAFLVTENADHVAMVLIERSGQIYVNEEAREKLKALWPAAYKSNMQKFIPEIAQQLSQGAIPINGVKVVADQADARRVSRDIYDALLAKVPDVEPEDRDRID